MTGDEMEQEPATAFYASWGNEADVSVPASFDLSGSSANSEPITQKISEEDDKSYPSYNKNTELSTHETAGQSTETGTGKSKSPDDDVLETFREMNRSDQKVSWSERYEVIKDQFPSIETLDWEKVFRADPTIMGNILNDIIKVDIAPKGRPGKRPSLLEEGGQRRGEAVEALAQYRSEDYSLQPFPKAFNKLKGTLSIRQTARKVSMSPTYAYNLVSGYKEPTVSDMELVAQGFGKDPSYFYEYRVAFIAALMAERIDYAPDSSIIYYERALKAKDAS